MIATKLSIPDRNWALEKLTPYIRERLKTRVDILVQLAALGRQSAVELFRAGRALHFVREKLKVDSAYCQWLEDNDIARTTAHEAIKLFYNAKTEEAVAGMTVTEAKITYRVIKKKGTPKLRVPKKHKEAEAVEPNGNHPAQITRANEYLVAMFSKLEQVVTWDRSDLDAKQLDELARRCIQLLNTFLLDEPTNKKVASKRTLAHVA